MLHFKLSGEHGQSLLEVELQPLSLSRSLFHVKQLYTSFREHPLRSSDQSHSGAKLTMHRSYFCSHWPSYNNYELHRGHVGQMPLPLESSSGLAASLKLIELTRGSVLIRRPEFWVT